MSVVGCMLGDCRDTKSGKLKRYGNIKGINMKVFISWSGDLSKSVASELRDWLPLVIQDIEPYFSPEDIDKGAKWFSEIVEELEVSDFGLICLTPENLNKPWILFEAGALSKKLGTARVCPLRIGVSNADLQPPLSYFNASGLEKDEILRLVKSINKALAEKALDNTKLETTFNKWWPELQEKLTGIDTSSSTKQGESGGQPTDQNVPAETLDQILAIVRRIEQDDVKRYGLFNTNPPVTATGQVFDDIHRRGLSQMMNAPPKATDETFRSGWGDLVSSNNAYTQVDGGTLETWAGHPLDQAEKKPKK